MASPNVYVVIPLSVLNSLMRSANTVITYCNLLVRKCLDKNLKVLYAFVMEITTEERDQLYELYDLILWYEKFAPKMPQSLINCDISGLSDEILYLLGYTGGWIDCIKSQSCAIIKT